MIVGDRVRLRAIERSDLPSYVKWLNDPEVRSSLSLIMPLSQTDEENWFDLLQKREPYERPQAIEIQPDPKKDEWVHVGNIGLFGFDWINRLAEVGLHIGEKKYWDQGFGTRVMKLILKHGFQTLNLNRIWLRVFDYNPRAIRTYEKTGFKVEGKYRQGIFHMGEYHDVIIMGILRSEWKP